jgi:hypothetical protein
MTGTGRFDADRLVDEAVASSGEADLGEPGWREGFDLLVHSLQEEARLNDLGVEIALGELAAYLGKRLALTAWRRDHPEVAEGSVGRPIFIIGQPRTGTTILHDLLAQDHAFRVPLTWEVDLPVPPPETATYGTDPRIAEVQATVDLVETVMPGFTTFHPMGAQLAQECVRITACDFKSMIYPIQHRIPAYNKWLLHEADLTSTYRWHRRYLQHLQSRHPAGQWLLKSPAHLWHLDALATEYPDAVMIQTHRDPLKVIASVSTLSVHLRAMASDSPSLPEVAADYCDDIFLGLDRGMEARDRAVLPPERVVDIHFTEFMADPLEAIGCLYRSLDRELDGPTEARMRSFLASNPGDGGGGGTRYQFSDTGLDADAVRQRAARYQERFGVASEPVR